MDRTLSFQHQYRTAMRIGRFGTIELLLSGSRRNGGESPDHAVAGRNIYPQALLWGSPHGCPIGESRFLGQSQTGSSIAAFNGAGDHLSEAKTEPGRSRPQNISLSPERIKYQSTEPGMEHRHHIYPITAGFRLPGCSNRLVQPLCIVLGNIGDDGNGLLYCRPGLGAATRQAGHFQHRSGVSVHEPGFYEKAAGRRNPHQYGRPWTRTTCCVCWASRRSTITW